MTTTNTSSIDQDALSRILSGFQLPHGITGINRYGSGHIHDTYMAHTEGNHDDVILQRINRNIFPDVPGMMENIFRVTEHVRKKSSNGNDIERCTLTLIPSTNGQSYFSSEDGEWWRAYVFIQGARTHDVIENPQHAYESGRAFADFQRILADLPAPPLNEVIPFFHHTPKRYEALEAAIDADSINRAAGCQAEIDFAMARKQASTIAVREMHSGALPTRVTHNDTKINNVMLDDASGKYVCVIDLDTVMPGTILYDFGDQVRTSVGHFEENEKDLSKVYVDMEVFDFLVSGYLSIARDFLVDREIELLCTGARLITGENGVRFLTDYLQGDTYFKTSYTDENLDRTRSQQRFVSEQESSNETMEAIIEKHR